MRTIKSLSGTLHFFTLRSSLSIRLDSISLQKKIITGTDRLKRLAITRSLLKRRTAVIRKQMSDLKNKLLNPFGKMKITLEPIGMLPSRTAVSRSSKPKGGSTEQIVQERGKLQILSLNNDLGRATDVVSHSDQAEVTKQNGRALVVRSVLISRSVSLSSSTSFYSRNEALQIGCSHYVRYTFTC